MKYILFTIICVIIFIPILKVGIERQIRHECEVWNAQAKKYPNFYWTPAQIDQCHPDFMPFTDTPWRNDMQKYNLYPDLTNMPND